MSRRLIISGGREPREMVLVGRMVVGRDPACDVSEADPLLSRRHAEFVAGTRDVVVRDLGSRNGILVNGVKRPQAVLHGGDVVQVGHLQLRYVDEPGPFLDRSLAGSDSASLVPTVVTPPPGSRKSEAFAPTTKVPPTPRPAPAEAMAAETTEIVRGPGNRFRFEKPRRGWRIVPGGASTLVSMVHDSGTAAIVVEGATLDASYAPDDVSERLARHESGILRGLHPRAEGLETRLDTAGERRVVVITYTRAGMAGLERVRQYSLRPGSELYRLTCTAHDGAFAEFEPVFAYVAATFETTTSTS